jgi:ABC-type bacteriocin/lantibiotic exporter with double-glycine peptidase domain
MVGAHLERVSDVLEAEPEQAPGEGVELDQFRGRIELRNVSFRYNPEAPWVLRNVSCVIEPGQKIALVGATGSGKSTIAMLLVGVYRPTEGEIYYDGIPAHKVNYRRLRNHFGIVLQDPFIFSGSIQQNISFGSSDISLETIVNTARLAALHEDITRMPMGYETVVSEGGTNLSGGQRQRLSIARSLAAGAKALILDEATSHLDLATEAIVDENLSALSCTRVVIAHRLSTIRNADQILVLSAGQVIERGTHDELLSCGGAYAALVSSQGQTGNGSVAEAVASLGARIAS